MALAAVSISKSELGQPEQTPRFFARPEWPLIALIVGFPIWWALGLSVFIFQLIAVPMALFLWRNRAHLKTPTGFGWWLAFLAWSALSLTMVWYTPPGTVDESAIRVFLVAAFRWSQYVTLGVMLLFCGNLPRQRMPALRSGWLLGLVFVYGTIGGLLAIAMPTLEFPSPLELALPVGVRETPWVQSMVHPSFAQVHEIIGEAIGRPAAPFGYTNMWGAVLAMTLPWFVVSWVLQGSTQQRLFAGVLLAASIAPIMVSLNRGLWIAIVFMVIVTAIRGFFAGNIQVVIATLAASMVALLLIAFSPLGTLFGERLDNQHSNQIREVTTRKALEVSTYSPMLGLGSTRDMVGSHQSIAIGKSPECPLCGNVPVGQNGQFWMVLVSQGWVGVILFFGMFVTALVRWWRLKTPLATAGSLSLLTAIGMTLYYDMMMIPMAFWMLSFGALWLASREADPRVLHPRLGTVAK